MNVFVEELSETQLSNIRNNISHVNKSGNEFNAEYAFDGGYLRISVGIYKRLRFFTCYSGTIKIFFTYHETELREDVYIDISNAKELYDCVSGVFEENEKKRRDEEISKGLTNLLKIKRILDGHK